MSATLLQIDFPFAGPWGADLAAACDGLARDIAAEPGLRWKLWTENQEAGRAGGIYLFDDEAACLRYLDKHRARLAGFGVTDIAAQVFAVNPALSALTRAPL
ncbi:monooxygenase [Azoarcus sp. DD4]|uniref:monooxygenase n=1 Tax=Azoarcus sp. DD4 TaxID=2027405 RepID=UPI001129602C|nr:monooxygenase [Azoarcus sp. DD4]QDF98289.1 monooxygenase [Azoarcus sp. DD4]